MAEADWATGMCATRPVRLTFTASGKRHECEMRCLSARGMIARRLGAEEIAGRGLVFAEVDDEQLSVEGVARPLPGSLVSIVFEKEQSREVIVKFFDPDVLASLASRGAAAEVLRGPVPAKGGGKPAAGGEAPPAVAKPMSVEKVAEADMDEVREEVRAVQACRSSIFVSAVAAVAASGIAVFAAAVTRGVFQWYQLLIASVGAFVLLSIGIFATLEKARAINIRRGFLSAVALLLHGKLLPSHYKGWAHLHDCFLACGPLRGLKRCDRTKAGPSCRDAGLEQASSLLREKRLVTSALDSFTSMSAYVFAIAYLGAGLGVARALLAMYASTKETPTIISLALVAMGAIVARYLVVRHVGDRLRDQEKKGSPLLYVVGACLIGCVLGTGLVVVGDKLTPRDGTWAGGVVVFGLALLLGLGFFTQIQFADIIKANRKTGWALLLACLAFYALCFGGGVAWRLSTTGWRVLGLVGNAGGVAAALGIGFSWLGVYLVDHLWELRKGKHAPETYHFAWGEIIKKPCPRFP